MNTPFLGNLVALELGGGFLSGLLVLGCAIFMIPLLLLSVFATLAVLAAVDMFIPKPEQRQNVTRDELDYNKPMAMAASLAIGVFGGMVGAPGAFIYIPVMIYLLHVPTRIVIGNTLGIVFLERLPERSERWPQARSSDLRPWHSL
jgi:uncharacterized membrane protein YfcA